MEDMNYSATENIPWDYKDMGGTRTWRWRTERFDSYIKAEAGIPTFLVQITDLSQGRRNVIMNSAETSFANAQKALVVFVARAYPRHEYGKYAGDAALTFHIHDGSEFNFAPYEGTPSTRVRYVGERGMIKMVTGSLQVNHHSIEITTEDRSIISIPPQLITDVRGEFDARGGSSQKEKGKAQIISGRTVHGTWKPGCTGRPGFKQNTVEHAKGSTWCPLHNI